MIVKCRDNNKDIDCWISLKALRISCNNHVWLPYSFNSQKIKVYLCPLCQGAGDGGHQAPPPGHQSLSCNCYHQLYPHMAGKQRKLLKHSYLNFFIRFAMSGKAIIILIQ